MYENYFCMHFCTPQIKRQAFRREFHQISTSLMATVGQFVWPDFGYNWTKMILLDSQTCPKWLTLCQKTMCITHLQPRSRCRRVAAWSRRTWWPRRSPAWSRRRPADFQFERLTGEGAPFSKCLPNLFSFQLCKISQIPYANLADLVKNFHNES